jgi:hypothetical protein
MKKNWISSKDRSQFSELQLGSNNAINGLIKDSIEDKKIIYNESFRGQLIDIPLCDLIELITSKLEVNEILKWTSNGILYSRYFVSDDSYLEVSTKNCVFQFVTNNASKRHIFIELCKKYLEKESDQQGAVNMLVQGPSGLYLSTIGIAGVPFNTDNYNDNIIDQFRKSVSDLKDNNPFGRITILSGLPGSGKTFCVRALLHECDNVCFIFIPSYMVSNLSAPSLVPLLAEQAEDGKPIVLIIEDADSCLVKRGTDNFSEVSTLLNLGDGILGSLLDIRIVCTTNAKSLDIDPALKRSGRLSQLIEINKLCEEKARKLLNKLNPESKFDIQEDTTLADIYAAAKESFSNGGNDSNQKKNKVGF